MTRFHILSILNVGAGLLLLPLSLAFGVLLAPLMLLGPLWILVLGVGLWRPGPRVLTMARRTHMVGAVVAGLLVAYGTFTLQAAARSASEGGGLLGAFGLIPIAYGFLLGAVSISTLLLGRPRRPL